MCKAVQGYLCNQRPHVFKIERDQSLCHTLLLLRAETGPAETENCTFPIIPKVLYLNSLLVTLFSSLRFSYTVKKNCDYKSESTLQTHTHRDQIYNLCFHPPFTVFQFSIQNTD